ncbi:MAG TPA: 2,3-diphosphoglycerate-dependent phosphoglycerate mutase [Longimicrobiaceae bacterium]|nr:2,3-diphosphoglycerate-dependent phosphoglycerate mutase [Longimicrobiaceae bacterium]
MHRLVLLRHGQSTWNAENRFTGWTDVDLTPLGVEEARRAGRLLAEGGFEPDLAFTSVLKRAIRTLWIALDELDRMWIPQRADWRLNERHYGDLQGKNKAESVARFGEEQVHRWRRSYATRPPELPPDDRRFPGDDPRYRDVPADRLPRAESLADTVARVLPYWESEVRPAVAAGKRVIVSAHGNSLRALVMHLDGMSEEEVAGLEIPTGFPLVYELDGALRPERRYYLGEGEAAAARAR